MKGFFLFLLIGALLSACNNQVKKEEILSAAVAESIRANQLGYFPDAPKRFYLADSDASTFFVATKEGKTVFEGTLNDHGLWPSSGETLKSGDFSTLNMEGEYVIYIPGTGVSTTFEISNSIYSKAAIESLRSFYFMRSGIDMEEKYLGKFARPAGHPDDTCYFHPSTGKTEGFKASPKGWYDAGDYGKYVINAAIATGTMLAVHETNPYYYPDGSLNIPESGNGINDLLDELKFEFDWVLTMQDDDGGVFHKMTSLFHDGITMPHETHSKRFFIGKSTAASLDFAAMLAQASRSYKDTDADFSGQCLEAAEKAYQWALDHPEEYYAGNPEGIGTGAYNDVILDEEFFWAAAELFSTTGDQKYYETIKPDLGNITFRLEESWRNYVDNIGYYSLLNSDEISRDDWLIIEKSLLNLADSLQERAVQNAYDIPVKRFVWGSNSDITNNAIIQIFAHHVSGDEKYLNAAVMMTDYIFGKNATGYSYVSGSGEKYSSNFHHRLLMADDNEETFPGFIAGGPNFQMQDAGNLMNNSNVSYPDTIHAKAYIDHDGSYASNEICINWNASLVFVLAYLDAHFNE
ncbi:MAG: glycoside hydrolase family 9 protein [Bacteroidales bacterium]|nr:glycoside hydrolase family 9 protein [Bacteroidales bacterium]